MYRQFRSQLNKTPRAVRILLIVATFMLASPYGGWQYQGVSPRLLELHAYRQQGGTYRIPKGKIPRVNLVVAATVTEDFSWVYKLKMPGLNVVPYIANNMSAPHHPRMNKGHEASIYLQYLVDFYDNLPAWHVDTLLDQSMEFSLNHLDLRAVQEKGFSNLRVTWGLGCAGNGINTTRASIPNGARPEEGEMQEAFRANFNVYDVPEILAAPCCSQIAVTEELVRAIPRAQLEHHVNWLVATPLSDALSGRVWEHMWHYLFLGRAVECPLEHVAYCQLYHICFEDRPDYDAYVELHEGRQRLEKELQALDKASEAAEKQRDARRHEEDAKQVDKTTDKEADGHDKAKAEQDGGDQDKASTSHAANDERTTLAHEASAAPAPKTAEAEYERTMRSIRATRRWLEDELRPIKEAIRMRREVAIVRGSVEANRRTDRAAAYHDEEIDPEGERPGTL